MSFSYYLFNKPCGVICQFSPQDDKPTLAHYLTTVEKDVYPVGRLDTDSEGLLLLSNDKKIVQKVLDPKFEHEKTYHVQIEGLPKEEKLQQLRKGVPINVDGKIYTTKPCQAKLIDQPAYLWERNPPVRFRKNIPTYWLEIKISEGKNRQVRKMTAAIQCPTLRLIRFQIGKLNIDKLSPSDYIKISESDIYNNIKPSGTSFVK